MARRWLRMRLGMALLCLLGVLALPATAAADSRVRLRASVEPAFPVAGEPLRLRVQVSDAAGRPLSKAQVVALAWMEPAQNPTMPAMEAGTRAGNGIRLVGRPQPSAGEHLLVTTLPMSGRWRAQVWVTSGGGSGTIPLDVDLLAELPPAGTNWPLVGLTWAAIAAGLFYSWRKLAPRVDATAGGMASADRPATNGWAADGGTAAPNPRRAPDKRPANMLAIAPLRAFLRSRWYPAVLQWPTLALFAVAVSVLIAGAAEAHDNLGSALVWVLWWPLLPLIFLLLGRFWCAVCPMSLLSDLCQRFFGRRDRVPAWLKRRGAWLVLGAFLAITWADLTLGLVEVPRNTAYLLLAVTAGVVACGLLFERRAWCRYLCPIGGLSGNYAMAAALELRADGAICKTCRGVACVRGDGRTPGCPMFEFPRTMAGNSHCNLCGNCLKTCPHDALRLTPRPLAAELAVPRRGRWDEALLAAMLLGAVSVQGVVMLAAAGAALGAPAAGGHGGGNTLVLTAIFLGLAVLPLLTLGLAGLLSAAARREALAANLLRFTYALIPLGLAAHLAHNLNHLLGEGRSVLQTASRLLGQPVYAALALESPATIRLMQYGLIAAGALVSLAITSHLARANGGMQPASGDGASSRAMGGAPYQVLVSLLAVALLVLFAQDMRPRLQLSGEAHEQVSEAQIAAAKAAATAFAGRPLPLEYVHLEEHGYRDVILRSGDTYYFVDIANMQVASMFSSRFRAAAPTPVAEEAARKMALAYAQQRYGGFARYDLTPADNPTETSPYPGGRVFEWRQRVDGITGPNYVKVTTDALGAVAIYSARDVPVTAPTQPLVDREEAIAIARRENQLAGARVEATLDIGPEMTGRQVLRWTVRLQVDAASGTRHGEVVVDARSGEVLSVVDW